MRIVLLKPLARLWNNKWYFGVLVAVFAGSLALLLRNSSLFQELELRSYDIRFGLRGRVDTAQDNIMILGIDDETFSALQTRWPLPRQLFAKAILNLVNAGARLIVLDVEFKGPDLVNARQDTDLARVVRAAGNVVLAGQIANRPGQRPPRGQGVSPPMDLLVETGAPWGVMNVEDDRDGVIRRYLAYINRAGETYFSLSIQAFLVLNGLSHANSQVDTGSGDLRIQGRKEALADGNTFLINFRGPARSFPTRSLISVIDDQSFELKSGDRNVYEAHLARGTFRDKVIFIGATTELLRDHKVTPFFKYKGRADKLPGVELHANALSTLLRGDQIRRQNFFFLVLTVFFLTGLSVWIVKQFAPTRGGLAVLGVAAAYLLWALFAFLNQFTWVEVIAPLTGIFIALMGATIHESLTDQRELRRLKKTWQHYLPSHAVEAMVQSGEVPDLSGERRELTVLFTNMRGFTNFSERHSSQEVIGRLNQYRTAMVDVIFEHSGTVSKFVGDEIMTIFGAPQPYQDHAERACLTALALCEKATAMRKAWSNGADGFGIGVGINTGNVILGNVGSEQVFDYSVIGDEVNLGAQLEAANEIYGTSIILSEFTYKSVRRKARVRELDRIAVKGRSNPVRIFQLLGMEALPLIEQDLMIHVYTEGIKLYREQKWYEALIEFKRVVRYFPTDGPSRLYIKRCLDFLESPPSDSWDGVQRDMLGSHFADPVVGNNT